MGFSEVRSQELLEFEHFVLMMALKVLCLVLSRCSIDFPGVLGTSWRIERRLVRQNWACLVALPLGCCEYRMLSSRSERCKNCPGNMLSLGLKAAACYYLYGNLGILESLVKVQLSPYQKETTNAGRGRGEGV